MTDTTDKIQALRDALAAFTPSTRWYPDTPTESLHAIRSVSGAFMVGRVVADVGYSDSEEQNKLHASLIVAAVNAAPALLAEVERLTAALHDMTRDRDSWQQQASDRVDDALRFGDERDAALAELAAARVNLDAATEQRSDLALLVGRLIVRMRAAREGKGLAAGDESLAQQAIGYMKRKGLVSVLRDSEDGAARTAA